MKLLAQAMTDRELTIDIGQGNPGAVLVACEMLNSGNRASLEKAHTLGLFAERLWLAYKDLGDQTIPTLVTTIESEDIKQRMAALGYALP